MEGNLWIGEGKSRSVDAPGVFILSCTTCRPRRTAAEKEKRRRLRLFFTSRPRGRTRRARWTDGANNDGNTVRQQSVQSGLLPISPSIYQKPGVTGRDGSNETRGTGAGAERGGGFFFSNPHVDGTSESS